MDQGSWKMTPEIQKHLKRREKHETNVHKTTTTIPLKMDLLYATNTYEREHFVIEGLNIIVPPNSSLIRLSNGDIITVPNVEEDEKK